MSQFADDAAAAVRATHRQYFGESTTYIPSGANSFPVSVRRKELGAENKVKRNAAGTTGYPFAVLIGKDEVASPQRNTDQIVIPGAWLRSGTDKTVRVGEVLDAGGGEWELRLASATR